MQGEHKFERYIDNSITSKKVLDDGRSNIVEGQQDRLHDLAAGQLRLPKLMSMDDIMKLDDIDEQPEEQASGSESYNGTDDEAGDLQDNDDDKPLFRLQGPKPSQSSAAVAKAPT